MRRARLLVPVVVVLLALAACTPVQEDPPGARSTPGATSADGGASSDPTEGAGEGTQDGASGEPALSVEPAGNAWVVSGTGFTGGNQYLVQCTGGTAPGAKALDACDMSTREQVVADEQGRIAATRQARAFVQVGSVREVDCTEDPCTLAVADLSDRVLASAPAPLPGDAETPAAPVLELSEQDLQADRGAVTVTGTGYPAGAVVRLAQCATTSDGAVDTENCLYDDGRRVIADRSGSVVTRLPVERRIELVGGGTADCRQAGACVVANARTDGARMAVTDLLWE
ncbi:neocarzinostatin apoprotein domain-containing protein [Promicromonospora sp. NPDC050880]|uniref:neocarzinostatin apoprotein domain-containing protein n=1 Tax=Promicromonospora sp. NPDC050880 TaxID=3364406 RepID=UPI003788E7D6